MSGQKTCVMWIGAHPDDERHCTGTLHKFVKNGHRAVICAVSKAEKGSIEISADELAKIRDKELAEAARIIGAEYYGNLGEPDLDFYLTGELVHKIVKAIRDVRPDIVITHNEKEKHDHSTVSKAVTHAIMCANHPCYDPGTPSSFVQRLYYEAGGSEYEPDFWIDVTNEEEVKLKSLAAHQTQVKFMGLGGDFLEALKARDRANGMRVHCKYAEAFKACRIPGYIRAELGPSKSLLSIQKI